MEELDTSPDWWQAQSLLEEEQWRQERGFRALADTLAAQYRAEGDQLAEFRATLGAAVQILNELRAKLREDTHDQTLS